MKVYEKFMNSWFSYLVYLSVFLTGLARETNKKLDEHGKPQKTYWLKILYGICVGDSKDQRTFQTELTAISHTHRGDWLSLKNIKYTQQREKTNGPQSLQTLSKSFKVAFPGGVSYERVVATPAVCVC